MAINNKINTEPQSPPPVGSGDTSSPELHLHYSFRSPNLLRTALTHSSRAHEHDGTAVDNEQLEFLGDAVLSLVTAQALLEEFPSAEEGSLTRLRASVVSRDSLAPVAQRLHLGRYMLLGRGEDRSGGRRKPAILADALEAVIAAIYLDGGLAPAADFVRREIIQPALPSLRQAADLRTTLGDHKTALQELLQADGQAPRYLALDESGPDHRRSFRVAVAVQQADGSLRTLAEAEGPTKKQAQQRAAQLALQHLQPQLPASPPSPETA